MTLRVLLSFAVLFLTAARGQVLMDGSGESFALVPTDAAILESHEQRTDLPCSVKPVSPQLGFDLALHSGYDLTVPFRELAGNGNGLVAIFRVTPKDHPDKAVYFSQKWMVPPVAEDVKGTVDLHGGFVLGEGKYQVEWLMRDRVERFCSAHWFVSADTRGKDRQIELRLPPGTVAPEPPEPYGMEPPVKRDALHPLNVLVLLHVASQISGAAGMRTAEAEALLSILRSIAREPHFGRYSITAFNLEHQETVFRREKSPQIDFPALGEAIKQLQLATIHVQQLQPNDSRMRFLGELLAEEIARIRPDILFFVGPKTSAEFAPHEGIKSVGEPPCPVFYLNYSADPATNPWRDLIGSVVKLWKGSEYTITKPRDVVLSWNDVMDRISNRERGPIALLEMHRANDLVVKK